MNKRGTPLMIAARTTKGDRGTTLVEYGLILLLIAVAVVLAVKMVGESTNNLWSSVNSEVVRAGS